ncbi:recombination regulator RecX [Streptomyces luteireticuli]|uniref:Regulatory protein RecX n=1 Tax=Streptomyces luteireticuli TaxID=173858 RepID=A0ABP3I4V7_9ACTN
MVRRSDWSSPGGFSSDWPSPDGSSSDRSSPQSSDGRSGGDRGRAGRGGRGSRGSRGERTGSGAEPPSRAGGGAPLPPEEQARAICLRLLTGSPRTRKQLAEALAQRGIPDDAAEAVLSRFEEVGLIDDAAFAGAWVDSRHRGRGLARRALARELRTKGVESAVIDEAVGRLDAEQEERTARELVERKLRVTRGMEREKRLRRLVGMLARKGYSEGLAVRVVRQALEEEGDDPEALDAYLSGDGG